MSGSYAIWINYNNDKSKYRIPVNPESIKVKVEGISSTADIDRVGTLLHKGRRGAMVVSWSGFFPASYDSSYCSCSKSQFKTPAQMHAWCIKMMEKAKPVHLVATGGPWGLNIYAVITSYTSTEEGGDPGTLQYSIELKEYRSVTVTKYKKNVNKKKSSSSKRVSNTSTPTTYTIKKGDTLWSIAKKFYGKGKKYTKIWKANKTKLDKVAKKHGYKDSNNGNRLFKGTKITIPALSS